MKLKIKFHTFADVFTINYFNVYVSNDNNNFEKDVCEGFNTTTELTKLSRLFIWTSDFLFDLTLKLWLLIDWFTMNLTLLNFQSFQIAEWCQNINI